MPRDLHLFRTGVLSIAILLFHLQLYSSAFRRTAAVMRNRSHVFNGFHFQACSLQSTDGSFTAGTGALYENFNSLQTMFHSSLGSLFSCHLGCKRGALTRTTEAHAAGRCPAQDTAVQVGDRNDRVIKGGANMCHTSFYILAYFPFVTDNFFPSHSSNPSLNYFFAPAAFFGPLRVRALFLVF